MITGASRGIGKEIGLKLAKNGANIVIATKTSKPHPKFPRIIFTTANKMVKKNYHVSSMFEMKNSLINLSKQQLPNLVASIFSTMHPPFH